MRVLTVSHYMPFYGGAEMVIVKLCQYMERQGIRNMLVAPFIPDDVRADLPDMHIVGTGGSNAFDRYWRLWSAVQRLMWKADVVNAHNFPSNMATRPDKRKPVVWMCNEPPEVFSDGFSPLRNLLLWYGRREARRIINTIVVPDDCSAERFKGIYSMDAKVIPYGVDYDFWTVGGRQPNETGTFRILQVGTVTPLKNQMATLEAAAELIKDIPNLHVYFVGWCPDDKYLGKLKEYAESHGLHWAVHFGGPYGRVALRSWYKTADLLVHPIKNQGGWLTPFEAICTGVPIVVSEEATCSRMILENNLGFVAHKTIGLIAHIRAVYSYPNEMKIMTARAQGWVKHNLTWDKFCSRFVAEMEAIK